MLEDINSIGGLGLPLWFIIAYATFQTLSKSGLLDPLKQAFSRFSEDKAKQADFQRERIADREEAQQELVTQLLDRVLNIADRLEGKLSDNTHELFRIRSELKIIRIEWSRIAERESDLDISLTENKEANFEVRQELTSLFLVVELLARHIEKYASDNNRNKAID